MSAICRTLIVVLFSLFLAAPVAMGKSDEKREEILVQLMGAISKNDYKAFVANGTSDFKSAITKKSFASVTSQVGELISAGYTSEYLTELNQQGVKVHLWKISYKTSNENTLAKLVMTNGKVVGFWLQ